MIRSIVQPLNVGTLVALSMACLLLGCSFKEDVEKRRASALSNSFLCGSNIDPFLPRIGAAYAAHGIRYDQRRDGPNAHISSGSLGSSQFDVMLVAGYASVAVFVERGGRVTARDRRVFRQLSEIFSTCRLTRRSD